MNLNLYFYRDKDEAPRKVAAYDWCDSIPYEYDAKRTPQEGKPISCGMTSVFRDSVLVEARLSEYDEEQVGGLYKLKVGDRSDDEPESKDTGWFESKSNKRMQLFRGASGKSWLCLLKRNSASEDAEYRVLARFQISVAPPPEKKIALDGMIDELLSWNPYDVVTETEGISRDKIQQTWVDGDVADETEDIRIKILEIETLLRNLRPWLITISKNSAERLIRCFQKIRIAAVRRFSAQTIRDVSRLNDTNIFTKARSSVLARSCEIPIHCAIKDFLLLLKSCAHSMQSRVNCSKTRIEKDIGHIPSTDKWRRKEARKNIARYEDFNRRLTAIANTCVALLFPGYPWSNCRRLPITAISLMSVPDTPPYRKVYFKMLEFRRKRFLWLAKQGRMDVPKYVRESEGESSIWQKNYSFIYEAWVFKRLVEAFVAEGFEELDTSFRLRLRRNVNELYLGPVLNEPIHANFRKGNMQIDMFYGIVAYPWNKNASYQEFTAWEDRKDKGKKTPKARLTPDFVIVFSRGMKDFHWIVLDAKAWDRLGKDAIDHSRDNYLFNFYRHSERPDQSWLIYSGSFGGVAGIEFDQDSDSDGREWRDDMAELASHPLTRNCGLEWKPGVGIVGWRPKQNQAVGHVRMNLKSFARNPKVLEEFAKTQIATAKARLGIS